MMNMKYNGLCGNCLSCHLQDLQETMHWLHWVRFSKHGQQMSATGWKYMPTWWMWPFRWPFRPSCGFSLPPPLSLFVSLLPVTPKAQGTEWDPGTEESHLAMLPLNCLKTSHRRCLGGSLLLGFYLIT